MNISPGATIAIEVVSTPRSRGAHKTLQRLFLKDATTKRVQRKRKHQRPSWTEWTRGGMTWHHQMKSSPPVRIEPGARYVIRATVDVLRDLASVGTCVKVSPA